MKKTIFCLVVILLLGSSLVTTTIAKPTIDPTIVSFKGGWGFKCRIDYASTKYNWTIELDGKHILIGKITKGALPSDGWIRTPIFPPAFGFGKINITVTLSYSILPPKTLGHFLNVTMIGPFVILLPIN